MSAPYPDTYRGSPVVVEPMGGLLRVWWGPRASDFFFWQTDALRYAIANKPQAAVLAPYPIGSRFD